MRESSLRQLIKGLGRIGLVCRDWNSAAWSCIRHFESSIPTLVHFYDKLRDVTALTITESPQSRKTIAIRKATRALLNMAEQGEISFFTKVTHLTLMKSFPKPKSLTPQPSKDFLSTLLRILHSQIMTLKCKITSDICQFHFPNLTSLKIQRDLFGVIDCSAIPAMSPKLQHLRLSRTYGVTYFVSHPIDTTKLPHLRTLDVILAAERRPNVVMRIGPALSALAKHDNIEKVIFQDLSSNFNEVIAGILDALIKNQSNQSFCRALLNSSLYFSMRDGSRGTFPSWSTCRDYRLPDAILTGVLAAKYLSIPQFNAEHLFTGPRCALNNLCEAELWETIAVLLGSPAVFNSLLVRPNLLQKILINAAAKGQFELLDLLFERGAPRPKEPVPLKAFIRLTAQSPVFHPARILLIRGWVHALQAFDDDQHFTFGCCLKSPDFLTVLLKREILTIPEEPAAQHSLLRRILDMISRVDRPRPASELDSPVVPQVHRAVQRVEEVISAPLILTEQEFFRGVVALATSQFNMNACNPATGRTVLMDLMAEPWTSVSHAFSQFPGHNMLIKDKRGKSPIDILLSCSNIDDLRNDSPNQARYASLVGVLKHPSTFMVRKLRFDEPLLLIVESIQRFVPQTAAPLVLASKFSSFLGTDPINRENFVRAACIATYFSPSPALLSSRPPRLTITTDDLTTCFVAGLQFYATVVKLDNAAVMAMLGAILLTKPSLRDMECAVSMSANLQNYRCILPDSARSTSDTKLRSYIRGLKM